MIGPVKTQRAKAFVAEFRKKHARDPHSYPFENLIRHMFLKELNRAASVTPVGPKTRAHTLRMKEIENGN
jgi:hypothetical protein